MKTIKQIADDIGVSKQTVRNTIAKLGLQSTLQKNGNSFSITEQHETAIKREFLRELQIESQSTLQSEPQSTLQSALRLLEKQNEQLSRELDIKNKQIDDLSTALVAAQQTAQAAQALHAGTIHQQLTDGAEQGETDAPGSADLADPQHLSEEYPEKRPSIFSRLFGGKK